MAISKSNIILEQLEGISSVGAWEYHPAEKGFVATDGFCRIFRIDVKNKSDILQESLRCYYPEDRIIAEKSLQNCIENGTPYDLTLSLFSFQPRPQIVRTRANAIASNGKIVKIVGSVAMVTSEEHLAKQERLHMIEGSMTGICHDMNNIWSIISNSCYFLKKIVGDNEKALKFIDDICQITDRGVSLIQQASTYIRFDREEKNLMTIKPILRESLDYIISLSPQSKNISCEITREQGKIIGNPLQIRDVITSVCHSRISSLPSDGRLVIKLHEELVGQECSGMNCKLAVGKYTVLELCDDGDEDVKNIDRIVAVVNNSNACLLLKTLRNVDLKNILKVYFIQGMS